MNDIEKKIEHKCFRCKNVFINLFDLKRHLNRKKKCISDDPNFSLSDEQVIKKSIHQTRKTNKKTTIDIALEKKKEICLTCPFCEKLYPSKSRLTQHKKTCKKRKEKPLANIIQILNPVLNQYNNLDLAHMNTEIKMEQKNMKEIENEEIYEKMKDFQEPFDDSILDIDVKLSCFIGYNYSYILGGILNHPCYINVIPLNKNISYVNYNGNSLMSNHCIVNESIYKLLSLKEKMIPFYSVLHDIPKENIDLIRFQINDIKKNMVNKTYNLEKHSTKIIQTYKNKFEEHDIDELKINFNLDSEEFNYIDTHDKLVEYLENISTREIITTIAHDNKLDSVDEKPFLNQVNVEYIDGKLKISGLFEEAEKKIQEEKENRKMLIV